MRKFAIAAVAAAALCVSTQAEAFTFRAYMSGAEYLKLPCDERMAFIEGLHDMMVRMCVEVDALSSSSDAAIFCRRAERCTSGMNAGQLTDFIESFMADRPDAKESAMASVYRAAPNIKCPMLTS